MKRPRANAMFPLKTSRLFLGGGLDSSFFTYVKLAVDPSATTRRVNLAGPAGESAVKTCMEIVYAARKEEVQSSPGILGLSYFKLNEQFRLGKNNKLGGAGRCRNGRYHEDLNNHDHEGVGCGVQKRPRRAPPVGGAAAAALSGPFPAWRTCAGPTPGSANPGKRRSSNFCGKVSLKADHGIPEARFGELLSGPLSAVTMVSLA